jgi:hypothetical protein
LNKGVLEIEVIHRLSTGFGDKIAIFVQKMAKNTEKCPIRKGPELLDLLS